MITKVANLTVLIPTANQLSEKNALFPIDEITNELMGNILSLISTYNDQNPEKKIDVRNPGIHVLSNFFLKELIKNTIDANASQFQINIYLEGEYPGSVLIQALDNGEPTERIYSEYCHLSELLKPSEKKNQGKLGGSGKGLAMASQYLALFSDGGLIAGSRPSAQRGFMVTICSENQPYSLEWNDYFSEFKNFYTQITNEYTTYDPNLVTHERQFRNNILEHTANYQRSQRATFFKSSNELDKSEVYLQLELEM